MRLCHVIISLMHLAALRACHEMKGLSTVQAIWSGFEACDKIERGMCGAQEAQGFQ